MSQRAIVPPPSYTPHLCTIDRLRPSYPPKNWTAPARALTLGEQYVGHYLQYRYLKPTFVPLSIEKPMCGLTGVTMLPLSRMPVSLHPSRRVSRKISRSRPYAPASSGSKNGSPGFNAIGSYNTIARRCIERSPKDGNSSLKI